MKTCLIEQTENFGIRTPMESLPNIFEYNNFRTYLKNYIAARKVIEPGFTTRKMAELVGCPNARTYISDVIRQNGGKDVTPTFIDRFIHACRLSGDEAKFFRCLVNFNQAADPDEREIFLDQLISLNRTPVRKLQRKAFSYFSEWHNGVIRALLAVHDFSGDFGWLARQVNPRITAAQARKSLQLLIDLKLVEKNSEGFFKPTEKSIATDHFLGDELIKNYQISCLELAKKAILLNQRKPQSITSRTISISKEGYTRLEKRIQKFSSELRSLVHKDEARPDRVYHLDLLLFPVSQI